MKTLIVLFVLFCFLDLTMSTKRTCKNISKDCARKAKQGWCSKNQSYAAMGRKCKKACGMCDNKSKYYNIDSRCMKWKKLGYCEVDVHSLYMARSCKFSCPDLVAQE